METGDEYFWRDLRRTDHTEFSIQEIVRATRSAAHAADQLSLLAHAVDDDLGITLSPSLTDVSRRITLLRLAANKPDLPDEWLTSDSFQEMTDRVAERHANVLAIIATRT